MINFRAGQLGSGDFSPVTLVYDTSNPFPSDIVENGYSGRRRAGVIPLTFIGSDCGFYSHGFGNGILLNKDDAELWGQSRREIVKRHRGEAQILLFTMNDLLFHTMAFATRTNSGRPAASHTLEAVENLRRAGCNDPIEEAVAYGHDLKEDYRHGRARMQELFALHGVPARVQHGINVLTAPCSSLVGELPAAERRSKLFDMYIEQLYAAEQPEIRVKIAESTSNLVSIAGSSHERALSRVGKAVRYRRLYEDKVSGSDAVGVRLLERYIAAFDQCPVVQEYKKLVS